MHELDSGAQDRAYSPPSPDEVAKRLGVGQLIELADLPREVEKSYSLQSVNNDPLSAEVTYRSTSSNKSAGSVMTWPKAGASVQDHYPDVATRVDDHVLNYLSNVKRVRDPLDGFHSSEQSASTKVQLDSRLIDATVFRNGAVSAVALDVGNAIATYVFDTETSTATLSFVTEKVMSSPEG